MFNGLLESFACFVRIMRDSDYRSEYECLIFKKLIIWLIFFIPVFIIMSFISSFFKNSIISPKSPIIVCFILDCIFDYPYICHEYFLVSKDYYARCKRENEALENHIRDYYDLQQFIDNHSADETVAKLYRMELDNICRECFLGNDYKYLEDD